MDVSLLQYIHTLLLPPQRGFSIGTIGLLRLARQVTWDRFTGTSIKMKIGAISPSNARNGLCPLISSYLALKTRIYQQNIQKVGLKTLYFNLAEYYRTVSSYLSRGNERLLKSQRFTHR